MNRKIFIFFSLLVIILSILVYWNSSLRKQNIEVNRRINLAFEESLDNSLAKLSLNYEDMEESLRLRTYSEIISYLETATDLSTYTSYRKKNGKLNIALGEAFMLIQEPAHYDIVIENQLEIYNYILDVRLHPEDVEKSATLIDFINKIGIY